MKRLLFLLINLLLCINCLAGEVAIQLSSGFLKDNAKDRRSLSIIPTASHDGNTICIHSAHVINDVEITVKDNDGNIVYSSNVPFLLHGYSFVINGSGEFILTIEYGDSTLLGYFVIWD